jgi:hypothetical protein
MCDGEKIIRGERKNLLQFNPILNYQSNIVPAGPKLLSSSFYGDG